MKEVADKLGWGTSDYEWLRKMATKGLSRVAEKKRNKIGQLCRYLEIGHYSWLWVEHATFVQAFEPQEAFFTVWDFRQITDEQADHIQWEDVEPIVHIGMSVDDAVKLVAWFMLANNLKKLSLRVKQTLVQMAEDVLAQHKERYDLEKQLAVLWDRVQELEEQAKYLQPKDEPPERTPNRSDEGDALYEEYFREDDEDEDEFQHL